MSFDIGDILFFFAYQFTDNNESAPHYGLVMLPSILMEYENSVLCSVITSRESSSEKKYCFSLSNNHECFTKNTYCCLNRRDIQSIFDLDESKNPQSRLLESELKKCFQLLKSISYSPVQDKYLIPTIIREWKILLSRG